MVATSRAADRSERIVAVVGGTSFGHPPRFGAGLVERLRTFTLDTPVGESPPVHELQLQADPALRPFFYVWMHGEESRHPDEPDGWDFVKTWLALHALGVTHAIGGATCGAIRPELAVGDLVVVDDFVMLASRRPRSVLEAGGIARAKRFPRFDVPFCPDLHRLLCEEASRETEGTQQTVHARGVIYQSDPGRFETPAEIRFMRQAGADLVSLNAVTEAIYARQLGIHFALLNSISNPAVGLGDFTFADMQAAVVRIARIAVPAVLRSVARVAELEHTCGEGCTGERYTGEYTDP